MRIATLLFVFLGLQGCGNRTGIKKAGVDASSEVAGPTGVLTNDSGATTEVDAPLAPPDAAPIVFPDAHSEPIGAPGPCYVFGSPIAKLSVQEVLDDAAGIDTSACVFVTVPGKVFEDTRQKRADWPAPVQSLFILQDGGELPGYTTSAPRPYIQLYSVHGMSPPMHEPVHVVAILRIVAVAEGNGPPAPFPYLEALLFTPDRNAPDGSTDQANGSADADGKTEARETPAGASFELRDGSSRVAADAGPCSPGFIRTWVMEFSADATTVKVIPVSAVRSVPVNGSLSDAPGPVLHYILNDAAGELLVWRQGNAWFAQLTRYGSGPEAGCVGGELILQAPL
jgi:hypothetical protein